MLPTAIAASNIFQRDVLYVIEIYRKIIDFSQEGLNSIRMTLRSDQKAIKNPTPQINIYESSSTIKDSD